MMTTREILLRTNAAKAALNCAGTALKNSALNAMAEALLNRQADILSANARDIEAYGVQLGPVMVDRLTLNPARIEGMAQGIRDVAALPDPVGRVLEEVARPNGLVIRKTAVPMGVVAIIFESRPNVTADAAALALKSGNACVLRGGKESYHSNAAIVAALRAGVESAGLPGDLIGLVEDTTRQSAAELMTANGLVDLLIPRGGAGLHSRLRGECHGALRADRNRHLSRLCGRGRGSDHGAEYHQMPRPAGPLSAMRKRFAWSIGRLRQNFAETARSVGCPA